MIEEHHRSKRVALIDSLQQRIEETLDPLVGNAAGVICLNVPFHTNVGDALIWLGTQAYLERKGIRIEYLSSHANASLGAVNRCDSRLILLQGGGNFGDLWPASHILAERVVAACPNHRIILLPQSMYFCNPNRLKQCQTIFARHPDLHLCLREEASYAACRRHFPVTPTYLCPDMAWCLGAQDVPAAPQNSLLILARTDREKRTGELASQFPADRCDWTGHWMKRCVIAGIDRTVCHITPLRSWIYTAHARHSLDIGKPAGLLPDTYHRPPPCAYSCAADGKAPCGA